MPSGRRFSISQIEEIGFDLFWQRKTELEQALVSKSLQFHKNDKNCPLAYEPSGEDFLSPCLMEADLMRRVFSARDFAVWLSEFLPTVPVDGSGRVIPEAVAERLNPETALVTVMYANSETGTLQPLPEIVEMAAAAAYTPSFPSGTKLTSSN